MDDVDAYKQLFEDAYDAADPTGFNTFVVIWSMGTTLSEPARSELLAFIEDQVEEGRAVWHTAGSMHAAFEAHTP